MPLYLVIVALLLAALSGVLGLLTPTHSPWNQRIATVAMLCSGLCGLAGAIAALATNSCNTMEFLWPALGTVRIGIDALTAFFLVPIFLIGSLGSLYGQGYWPYAAHQQNSRKLVFFWGILVAGMALITISRHALLFLLGWETMALAAYFLVTTEEHHAESLRAGWIYLIAAHVSTLTLFALFALWRHETGSYALQPLAGLPINLPVMHLLFLLAFVGFGLKAGILPFHFWIPAAHANAPSHVSALLSGVVLKMGIYGLLRWFSFFEETPLAWGKITLILGCVSGLLGVIFALAQHDLKRLLAYHSVENIGIILLGLGVALTGRALQLPWLITLGMAGCLLHVWNHCLFKSLLFMGAGSVVNETGTRSIDRLGGLCRAMPFTAAHFLLGAIAICGLPPLNGFISELFIFLGLFHTVLAVKSPVLAPLAVVALAMIGALAGACFVKVYGVVFLGNPRQQFARQPKESPLTMKLPMLLLGALCLLIGVAPQLLSSSIYRATQQWCPESIANALPLPAVAAPLQLISIFTIGIALCIAITILVITTRRKQQRKQPGTWDCGYATPTNRMQYTSSSFADSIIRLFAFVLHPHREPPAVKGIFPLKTTMQSHVNELVLDRLLLPVGKSVKRAAGWLHRFQQGQLQQYIFYLFIMLMVLLGTQIPIKTIVLQWMAK